MSDPTVSYTPDHREPEHPGDGLVRVPIVDGYRAGHEAIVPAPPNVPPTLEFRSTAYEGKYTYALAATVLPIERYGHNLAYVQVKQETAWSAWPLETD
jgi:hypothetical protein